jgi:hypothetical protein
MANLSNINNKFLVTTGGDVGIGTTSPSEKLHVVGNAYISGVGNKLLFDTTGALGSNGIKTINDYETVIFNDRGSAGFAVIGNSNIRLGFGTNYTNAETDLFISSAGDVGIGTTSPGYKLEVNGNAEFLNNVNIKNNSYDDYQIAVDSVGFSVYNRTDAAYNMTISHTGNVGIGTTSPNVKLQITGNSTNSLLLDPINSAIAQNVFFDGSAWDSVNHSVAGSVMQLGTDGSFAFRRATAADPPVLTYSMYIDSNGNVGIGTTSPSDLLSLVKTSGDCVLGLTGNTSGDPEIHMDSGNDRSGNIKYGDGTTSAMFRYAHNDVAFKFYAHNQTDVDFQIGENTSFFANSNVGIGTTSFTERLRVQGNSGSDLLVRFQPFTNNAQTKFYLSSVSSGDGGYFYNSNDNTSGLFAYGDYTFYVGTSNISGSIGNARMIIKQDGNVGIGVTSPAYGLDVQKTSGAQFYHGVTTEATANIRCRHDGAETTSDRATQISFRDDGDNEVGSIKSSGSATFYNTSSDYRLKQNEKDFNGLDLVDNIKVYDFEWKKDGGKDYGVFAHELQEIVPEAVSGEKDGEEMQGVDYSKIVPLLIKSIQELEARVKELENK